MVALIAAALVQAPAMLVSTASVDLSPPEPLPLGGYTERRGKVSSPGGDPLHARALLIRSGEKTIALVSAEMLTIPESLQREVAKRLPKDVELFLAATHTHCAPDSQMLNERMTFSVPGIARFDAKWLEWYADRIAASVAAAAGAPQRATDGPQVLQFHIDLNRARRPGAIPDETATVVTFPPEFGFAHYAAHPVLYGADENQTRSDWPGPLAQLGMTLLGPIGGVSPDTLGQGTPAHRVSAFAMQFMGGVARRLDEFEPYAAVPMRFVSQEIALGKTQPHPTFASTYGVDAVAATLVVSRFAPPKAEITAFRIGKLAVVGVPGEPSSHLGRRIRDSGRAMGFSAVLVVSHVNGWMGYILDAADYRQGGYEATLSFYGEEQGEKVVEAAIAALRALAKPTSPR